MDFLQKWMTRKVLFLQVTRNSFPDSKIPFLVYHLRLPYVLLKAVKAVTKYVPKRGGKGNLMFGSIRNYFSNDLAIDLGTANTLIYCRGKGMVLNEPSVVAVRTDKSNSGKLDVRAVGQEAKNMLGRVPGNIDAIRPMKDGVIANFTVTEQMLKSFIKKVHTPSIFTPRPRIVICVPYGSTQVERRAIKESAEAAGAKQVYLIEEPMAAALGAGLPVSEAAGSMVIDIGGGTADIAVISLGGVVESASIKIAGDKFDEAVVKYIRRKHNVLIGDRTAEELKMKIGCVFPRPEEVTMEIKGRCLMTGLPRVFSVSSSEMIEAFEEVSSRILEAIHGVLERTPPELVADISTNGIVMTGGGSLLWGFDKLIESHTGIETHVAEDAISCVAEGTGKSLDSLDQMQDGTMNLSRRKQMNY